MKGGDKFITSGDVEAKKILALCAKTSFEIVPRKT